MRPVVVLLSALLFAAAAGADVVYVDDSLRVGVRNNPGNTESPLEVVTSGAALEVLERGENGYMRIRTASGVEGWVSSVYVTNQPPARALLEQMRQENARLQNELHALRGGAASAASAVPTPSELDDLRKENAQLVVRVTELTAGDSRRGDWLDWAEGAGLLVALFILGIVLGKRHERQRVASRFNGLQL
jgi:SH3 domain protein